jgi:hypothetical protein
MCVRWEEVRVCDGYKGRMEWGNMVLELWLMGQTLTLESPPPVARRWLPSCTSHE